MYGWGRGIRDAWDPVTDVIKKDYNEATGVVKRDVKSVLSGMSKGMTSATNSLIDGAGWFVNRGVRGCKKIGSGLYRIVSNTGNALDSAIHRGIGAIGDQVSHLTG